jgi:hypothetical protein
MKYATFVEIIIQRFGQYVNNVYLCIKKCVYGRGISWQQGTVDATQDCILGFKHHTTEYGA